MAPVIVFAAMVATVLAMLVYTFFEQPKRPTTTADGTWRRTAFRHMPVPASPRRPPAAVAPTPAPQPAPPAPRPARLRLSWDPVEHDLLVALRDQPADPGVRMVYADWLEERGHAAKANAVRGVERTEDVPTVLKDLVSFADGFDRTDDTSLLLAESNADWRAIACRDRTDCGRRTCPRQWDLFIPVAEGERRCFVCSATVRYCASADEARASTARGERVVLDLAARVRR
jgi:uncharacterized protein (TIGR02996 family)